MDGHSSMSRVEADQASRGVQAAVPIYVVPQGKWQTLAEGGYFHSKRVKGPGGQSLQPAGISSFHIKTNHICKSVLSGTNGPTSLELGIPFVKWKCRAV